MNNIGKSTGRYIMDYERSLDSLTRHKRFRLCSPVRYSVYDDAQPCAPMRHKATGADPRVRARAILELMKRGWSFAQITELDQARADEGYPALFAIPPAHTPPYPARGRGPRHIYPTARPKNF